MAIVPSKHLVILNSQQLQVIQVTASRLQKTSQLQTSFGWQANSTVRVSELRVHTSVETARRLHSFPLPAVVAGWHPDGDGFWLTVWWRGAVTVPLNIC